MRSCKGYVAVLFAVAVDGAAICACSSILDIKEVGLDTEAPDGAVGDGSAPESSSADGDSGGATGEGGKDAPQDSPVDSLPVADAAVDADAAQDGPVGEDAPAQDAPQDGAPETCFATCGGIRCGATDGCGSTCQPGGGCLTSKSFGPFYTELSQTVVLCQNESSKDTWECTFAAYQYCRTNGWATGFPIDANQSQLTVVCVWDASELSATGAELTAKSNACVPSGGFHKVECESACARWCNANGYKTGFGPVGILPSDTWTCSCFPNGTIVGYDTAPLPTFDNCPTHVGIACYADANAFCQQDTKYAFGFGPTEVGTDASVICVLK